MQLSQSSLKTQASKYFDLGTVFTHPSQMEKSCHAKPAGLFQVTKQADTKLAAAERPACIPLSV